MKKKYLITAIVLTLGLTLSACGSKEGDFVPEVPLEEEMVEETPVDTAATVLEETTSNVEESLNIGTDAMDDSYKNTSIEKREGDLKLKTDEDSAKKPSKESLNRDPNENAEDEDTGEIKETSEEDIPKVETKVMSNGVTIGIPNGAIVDKATEGDNGYDTFIIKFGDNTLMSVTTKGGADDKNERLQEKLDEAMELKSGETFDAYNSGRYTGAVEIEEAYKVLNVYKSSTTGSTIYVIKRTFKTDPESYDCVKADLCYYIVAKDIRSTDNGHSACMMARTECSTDKEIVDIAKQIFR